MNELVISTDGAPVVCGCGFLTASEPFYHADRVLAFNVLIYVQEGAIYVTEDETDYAVNGGELLFLKSGIRHFGKKAIPRGTKWYFVHFYLKESKNALPFKTDPAPLGTDEPLHYTAPLPKTLSASESGETERKLAELIEYCHSDDAFKRMRINCMMQSLLTDIALLNREKEPDTLSVKIREWLSMHSDEPFSAKRLEREFFLSYKRMAAVYKKEQGETMQQYHLRCRMLKACRMLRSTLLPISEIAASLGYEDPLYFSKRFRAFAGASPRDYRAAARAEY